MLIDKFIPNPDAKEVHTTIVRTTLSTVYQALWNTDFASSWLISGLLLARALPKLLLHPGSIAKRRKKLDLRDILEGGFGVLAEDPGKEIVLGVAGRFWRPVGNLLPFNVEDFKGPVPVGTARAAWNFTLAEAGAGATRLTTETRVVCGDPASRRKFRLYWLFVRPFSGLIRRLMLRLVRRACQPS